MWKNVLAPGSCVRRCLLAWLLSAGLQYVFLPSHLRSLSGLDGLRELSMGMLLAVVAVVFCGFCLLALWLNGRALTQQHSRSKNLADSIERWCIFAVFGVMSVRALSASFTVPFLCVCLLIWIMLGVYCIYGWNGGSENIVLSRSNSGKLRLSNNTGIILTAFFTMLFFIFVSIWTVCRVKTFSAPTYDFGIFSQMFHHMRTTGLPNTTLERDGLLSHFDVHVSPIYYLMLPFYCIYPEPETLQILQAAILAFAVIPLWKICRRRGWTSGKTCGICLLLLLWPAYAGGTGYDLHENAFLTPLLLWLFYAVECRKGWMLAVFTALTLFVKEDAAVYVAVIALWLLIRTFLQKNAHLSGHKADKWCAVAGSIMLAASVVWFLLVTAYLSRIGDGVMTYRYDNFIYDGSSSLFTVIKAVMLCPMKLLYECVDSEKLMFILWTLLPLGGIGLLTRRYERFILWIPYILVNLMSDYTYQHDIFFQYTYGSAAFLMYLTVVNLQDLMNHRCFKNKRMRFLQMALLLLASGICFGVTVVPEAMDYTQLYVKNHEKYAAMDHVLEQIPKEASVTATTFYTVPLSGREMIYDVRYGSREHLLSTEYIVLAKNDRNSYKKYGRNEDGTDGYENLVRLLVQNGYEPMAELEDTLVIYRKALHP